MAVTHLGTPLTERELRVLLLLAQGYTSSKIGTLLGRSEATAKGHLRTIYIKLGARNGTNAVHIAHKKGLLA